MATRHEQGGASASPIAALPAPKHPRRADRFESMGEEALRILRYRGEPIPANVVALVRPAPLPTVTRSPELALLVCVFLALPESHQANVKARLRLCADDDPHFAAALVLLSKGGA